MYDFSSLSPYDLEILARDLLQAELGVRLESFKSGKDGGIDLRFAVESTVPTIVRRVDGPTRHPGENKTVVQVKHYATSGFNALLRELRREDSKLAMMKPKRYLLVTSVPLSARNKDQIASGLSSMPISVSDIYGAEDLNNLLGRHKEVERRHIKLWLTNEQVLVRALHNAEATKSEFLVRSVYREARKYVACDALPIAHQILQENKVVIISGPPGVGKTTLANLMLYNLVEQGFQAVVIQRDVEEGERLFQDDVRQVFYFDDFLGATFSGERAIDSSNFFDKTLLNFIGMVQERKKALFILTTREHVYSQAISKSERLKNSTLGDFKFVLTIPRYTRHQRAAILYNHIYFSDLELGHRLELLRETFYLRIVDHKNFNPRLISWLSSSRRISSIPVSGYRKFVAELLDSPSEIWNHAYEHELSDSGRSLLLALFSFGGSVHAATLSSAFSCTHA